MAEQWQWRRGTGIENDAFIGAEGEITVDLTNHELRVHTGDGKEGGYKLGRTTDRTNCITEIPQDINLELNNGTLTLKAGSKIYVPNGVGVFDEVVIENDIVASTGTSVTSCFLFYNNSNSLLNIVAESSCYSGDTEPTTTPYVWYNIANNIITRNTGSSTFNYSLPLAKITCNSSSQIVSIDQVFNGFGYIGSTVFALPGVKGLIPDGRNLDGTLKNNLMAVQNVITKTIPSNTGWHYLSINASGTSGDFRTGYYQGSSFPTSAPQFSIFYNYDENLSYLQATVGVWTRLNNFTFSARIEHESSSPYKIISIQPVNVFHAVDYSEADFVVSFQRPTPANDYTWYRLYKSGWVEQGGISNTGSGTSGTITLPITMQDNNYTAIAGNGNNGANNYFTISRSEVTTTTIKWYKSATNMYGYWQVNGMAA